MKLDPEAIESRVLRFVEARELFRPGPLVVAVSGGQDSLCMLDLLRRLGPRLRLDLQVAHLDHMFRGDQSRSEAEYVRELATRWGLPAIVAVVDVPSYRARHRLSKQVAARYARYQFLSRMAARVGADQVAVGHTADDAVETLLLNLLRGAGLAGLRGMPSSREMEAGQLGPELDQNDWRTEAPPAFAERLPTIVRPILSLFRGETEAYCRARGLAFRRDPSNLDMAYRRNWIRARLLPLLEEQAPGAGERLLDTADLLSDEYAVVSREVERAWCQVARVRGGLVEFDLAPWAGLDIAIQRQLLRRAMAMVAGSPEGFGRVHVDGCEAAIRRGGVGSRVDLPWGVYLEKGYTSFWLASAQGPPSPGWSASEEPVVLPVPGVATMAGASLGAELLEGPQVEELDRACRQAGRWEACLDADQVGPKLVVRRREAGDRFVPLGMDQPKKLHDFMVDAKIPRGDRDRIPLVATPDRIAWVVGYRIDDRFKITAGTRRILKLRFQPLMGDDL